MLPIVTPPYSEKSPAIQPLGQPNDRVQVPLPRPRMRYGANTRSACIEALGKGAPSCQIFVRLPPPIWGILYTSVVPHGLDGSSFQRMLRTRSIHTDIPGPGEQRPRTNDHARCCHEEHMEAAGLLGEIAQRARSL
jgi:hypothetical protein